MLPKFERFVFERKAFKNVSSATVDWYRYALIWLNSEDPTRTDLHDAVLRMTQAGLKPTAINSYVRVLNAYAHWFHDSERPCSPSCTHPRLRKLKEDDKLPATFSDTQVKALVNFRPKSPIKKQLHLIVLLILDTGTRASEALGLRMKDVDFANGLMTVFGKGRKHRVIPFSSELKRRLYKFTVGRSPEQLLFQTRNGRQMNRRDVLRSVKRLCHSLGFKPPERTIHAMRHSFACAYIKNGGSVFHLQKVLGHRTLDMTRRYANLVTSDLQAVHERLSLLSRNR